ncbi:hypothetical protein DL93DRAFT_1453407 [Clavulina sp. PMI_390]|nr:hypothetical protein DL93DRAFT_1453407 [Clavulina sp. PMI_390]
MRTLKTTTVQTPKKRSPKSTMVYIIVALVISACTITFGPHSSPFQWISSIYHNVPLIWIPTRFQYPPAQRIPAYNLYRSAKAGIVNVSLPYQWMEADSDKLEHWVAEQGDLTTKYTSEYREKGNLHHIIEENHSYKTFSTPSLGLGNRWYWTARSATQQQAALYRSMNSSLPRGVDDLEEQSQIWFDVSVYISQNGPF